MPPPPPFLASEADMIERSYRAQNGSEVTV